MSTIELDPDTATLTRRALALDARIKEAALELESLKAELRQRVPAGTTGTIDGRTAVSIIATSRFDPALAETTLPPALLDLCRVTKVDPAEAKKQLPPHLYSACTRETANPTVRLG